MEIVPNGHDCTVSLDPFCCLLHILILICSDPSDEEPVYEKPPPKYAAEHILQILLDPHIPALKVCSRRPTSVQ